MTAHITIGLLATSLLFTGGVPAHSQPSAEFYRGKSVNVMIGVGAGGLYDLNARLVARHIGRHIPGNPALVPQNMPGAGGATMVAWLADVAAKDGTFIGMIANNFPAMQAAGSDAIRTDLGKFQWIGSISPLTGTMSVWKTSGVESIRDAQQREIITGASGRGAETFSMPAMLNEFLGTRFKIVMGYKGGNDINLAMERGEVQARYNFWSSWKTTRPEWLKNGDVKVIVYMGPKPKDLPGVPSVSDLVTNEDDRKVVDLIISGTRLGTPLAFSGGVPLDRVTSMRGAFAATMKDPEFLKEAQKLQIEVDPVAGEALQAIVVEVIGTPKHLAAKARAILE
jgi:tripartite-type tricarboxylate transporter receptor subunit TctC